MIWRVEAMSGSAETLHHADLDMGDPVVYPMSVTRPAVVVGSTQPESDLAVAAVTAAGLDVVRRRSGGGLVLLVPGEHLWVDVVVPKTAPGWLDDVDAAAVWMGSQWRRALERCGVASDDVGVHQGRPIARSAGRQVCFAGIGSGEVLVGGRKLIGISQRRSRLGARFQCSLHVMFDVPSHLELVAERVRDRDLADRLAEVATIDRARAQTLVGHVVDVLNEHDATILR